METRKLDKWLHVLIYFLSSHCFWHSLLHLKIANIHFHVVTLQVFFPSNSLQLVNDCKNLVLNWVMKLNLFTQTPLKIFPFYSLIILTLWFRYLQIRNSKIPRKIQEKCISQWIENLNFNKFSLQCLP